MSQVNRWISSRSLALAMACLGAGVGVVACAATPTQESTGQVVDDSWITTKVKAAFLKDEAIHAADIKVETFKGTVQLSGFANSAAEINHAVDVARGIKGVKSVKNEIQLKQANP
jgi:osmotically-inducible protein OsmY